MAIIAKGSNVTAEQAGNSSALAQEGLGLTKRIDTPQIQQDFRGTLKSFLDQHSQPPHIVDPGIAQPAPYSPIVDPGIGGTRTLAPDLEKGLEERLQSLLKGREENNRGKRSRGVG